MSSKLNASPFECGGWPITRIRVPFWSGGCSAILALGMSFRFSAPKVR